jgi:hypothetical protein
MRKNTRAANEAANVLHARWPAFGITEEIAEKLKKISPTSTLRSSPFLGTFKRSLVA